MKRSLKFKLTISYVLLSLFLIFSFLIAVRLILNDQFKNYIKDNLQKSSEELVNRVKASYTADGTPPSYNILRSLGDDALAKGFILKIDNNDKKTVWCMECFDQQQCGDMLDGMERNMNSVYPNFSGEYEEKIFDLNLSGISYGTITLGYYGPFYYSNSDLQFLSMINLISACGAVLALILAIGLGYFMANRIVSPVKKVIAQAGRIESGNYQDLISFSSNTNEVDQLIKSVNSLATTLHNQQMQRKRLAQDYAHEFRTPLASLQANLEAMIDGIWAPDKERLESCNEEILRLKRMISGIDKLVEIEDENIVLNCSRFSMYEFVNKMITNFESDIADKQLHVAVSGSEAEILADKDKIGQVVVNLLSNAIKYTDTGGSIHITTSDKGNEVVFSISDTGMGIGEEDLPHIFEHLYRADKSRASATGGSGVGLAVVKAIVDTHKGKIQVHSELSKGSTFIVTLPK